MTPAPAAAATSPARAYDLRGTPDCIGSRHFWIAHNGRSIGFCYIRKNACSAFKALVLRESPHRDALDPALPEFRFLRAHHTAKLGRLARCDHVILVVREPVGRLVSAFRNKFVQGAGNDSLFASFRAVTGRDPETASFRNFVDHYLARPDATLDKHVRPQADHLMAVHYTDAVTLEHLHAAMLPIFGRETADRYFAVPRNSSRGSDPLEPGAAADLPAGTLHRHYAETGRLPSDAALVLPDLAERCAALYARDAQLYREIAGSQ